MDNEIKIIKKGWGHGTRYLVMLGDVELGRFNSIYRCRIAVEETFGVSPKVVAG